MANRVPPSSPTPPPTPRAPEAPTVASKPNAVSHDGARGFAEENVTKVRGQGAVSPVRTSSLKAAPNEAQNIATTRVDVGELRAALRASKRSDPPSPSRPGSTPPETARGDDLARKLDALAEASLEAPRVPTDLALPPTPRMPANPSPEPPDQALEFGSSSEQAPRPLPKAEIPQAARAHEEVGPSSEVPSTKRSSTAPPLDAHRTRTLAYAYAAAAVVVLVAAFLAFFVASGGSFARMKETLLALFGH